MNDQPAAPIHRWLAEPLTPACETAVRRLAHLPGAVAVAVMPDAHPAARVCNGVSLATVDLVYPQAVGADIGCGMTTACFEAEASVLRARRVGERLFRAVGELVPTLRHRRRGDAPSMPGGLSPGLLSTPSLRDTARRDGVIQFGTLGRGNHFIEWQADRDGRVWVLVHSGSRGMGQAITTHHLPGAAGDAGPLVALSVESPAGRAYADDASWAVAYAEASRHAVLDAVADAMRVMLGVRERLGERFGTAHNTLTREVLEGRRLWVHRKGAAPAHAGVRNIIPGSCATESFHVRGLGVPGALWSSSHGAGRVVSRGAAGATIGTSRLAGELRNAGVVACGATPDESPSAYRDIRAVMRAQRELVRIEGVLRPLLNYRGR